MCGDVVFPESPMLIRGKDSYYQSASQPLCAAILLAANTFTKLLTNTLPLSNFFRVMSIFRIYKTGKYCSTSSVIIGQVQLIYR